MRLTCTTTRLCQGTTDSFHSGFLPQGSRMTKNYSAERTASDGKLLRPMLMLVKLLLNVNGKVIGQDTLVSLVTPLQQHHSVFLLSACDVWLQHCCFASDAWTCLTQQPCSGGGLLLL